jgi:hypothetical protein
MATDPAGRLWFTEVLPGKLGLLDPTTGTLTELPVPALARGPPALYALVIDHRGTIWFVDVGANALVRYAPGKQTLTFFHLSLPGSAPFGLTLDPAGNVWFTAGGSSANYVGEIVPYDHAHLLSPRTQQHTQGRGRFAGRCTDKRTSPRRWSGREAFAELANRNEQEQRLIGSCAKDAHLSGSISDVEPIQQSQDRIVERGQDMGCLVRTQAGHLHPRSHRGDDAGGFQWPNVPESARSRAQDLPCWATRSWGLTISMASFEKPCLLRYNTCQGHQNCVR